MLEFVGRVECDVVALVQATSPLTSAEDFRAARGQFERESLDSLLTGVETKRFFWTREACPLNYEPARRPRRQDFAGSVMENGAFYFTRRALLTETCTRLGGRIGVHVMSQESGAELDEPSDWPVVEALLRKRLARAANIRMLVIDVDGTLTDGGMYYSGEGEALKKFNTRDAKGMLMLRDAGFRVCVLTAENSAVVHARMRKLQITDYFPGVNDKPAWLREKCSQWGVEPAQIAYIGDDLNDLECLRVAGLSCCPADAVPEVRSVVQYVCSAAGGHGAVREVCDLIRASISREES
jgi:N-acylneuraminate cytidylyltransferase